MYFYLYFKNTSFGLVGYLFKFTELNQTSEQQKEKKNLTFPPFQRIAQSFFLTWLMFEREQVICVKQVIDMLAPGCFPKRSRGENTFLPAATSPLKVDLATGTAFLQRLTRPEGVSSYSQHSLPIQWCRGKSPWLEGFLFPRNQGFVLQLNFHLPNSPAFIGQSAERKGRDRGRTREQARGWNAAPAALRSNCHPGEALSLLTGRNSIPACPLPSRIFKLRPGQIVSQCP